MILMSNLTKKKASSLKVIDYILAAPAAFAVEAFITGFHSRNKFYELGKTEFAIVAGIATWMKTAETVALYREFIISCIEEVKNG